MRRLLFEKTGNAIWISHLDLMRVFQRAFKRAGLALTHTKGFNPRPSVSIALPLSVGVESHCELLDFDLDGEIVSDEEICTRLNRSLIDGVRVLCVYGGGKKLRDLSLMHCSITLEYDTGVPSDAVEQISQLLTRDEVLVSKKTKNGIQEQNISSMIRNAEVYCKNVNEVVIDAVICCQNPTLNPMQICVAIEQYLPHIKPDFSKCIRLEIYDLNKTVFR